MMYWSGTTAVVYRTTASTVKSELPKKERANKQYIQRFSRASSCPFSTQLNIALEEMRSWPSVDVRHTVLVRWGIDLRRFSCKMRENREFSTPYLVSSETWISDLNCVTDGCGDALSRGASLSFPLQYCTLLQDFPT